MKRRIARMFRWFTIVCIVKIKIAEAIKDGILSILVDLVVRSRLHAQKQHSALDSSVASHAKT